MYGQNTAADFSITVTLSDSRSNEKDAVRAVWELYEREKATLQRMALSTEEYEKAVRDLTRRLGL